MEFVDRGEVIGIKGVGRNNRPLEFSAGAVILGCGGFEGNPEMMTHYIGQRATYLRAMSTGGHYNKGEGIRMALEIGADQGAKVTGILAASGAQDLNVQQDYAGRDRVVTARVGKAEDGHG